MRNFTAQAVNVTCLVDFTEHWIFEGKIYRSAIKDCASKRIVGYAINSRVTSELTVNALRLAIMLRAVQMERLFIAIEPVSSGPRSSP